MKLLVIRHGTAEDAEAFAASGRSDDERPLTTKGSRDMGRVAAGLRTIVERIDVIAPSPLVRARETAEIVANAYGMTASDGVDAFRPTSSLDAFIEWSRTVASLDVVAIVGHNPHLPRLVTWLMSGIDAEHVALKKGGACLLKVEGPIAPNSAMLRWLLTPAQLVGCAAAGS